MGPRRDSDSIPVRFSNPPVKRVALTLRFTSDGSIQASHVAPLRVRWAEEFPLAEEAPPLTPYDVDAEGPTFLSSDEAWPLPFTRYSNNTGDRSIAFQNDRLQVSWRFEPDTPSYPGFDALAGELSQRFAELKSLLADVGVAIVVDGARCDYLNVLDRETSAQAAVGVLTDWGAAPSARVDAGGFVGVHIHPCQQEEEHGCNAVLSTEAVGEDATLRVSVERDRADEGEGEFDGLREAHDELVNIFLDFTTEEQKRRWGQL